MKSLYFLIIVFSTFGLTIPKADAQMREIELFSERNSKSGIDIYAKTHVPGSFTVFIHFTSLENASHRSTFSTVVYSDGKLLTLNPIVENKSVSCHYSYYSTRGYKPQKVDSAFIYRLPFSEKKTEPAKAFSLYNVRQQHLKDTVDNSWASWQFMLNQGDTVFAIRKGLVIRIIDEHEPLHIGGNVSFSSKSNDITIEHEDGTLSSYRVVEKGSFMVSVGDVVYPGTPLAKAGTYSKIDKHQIRIHIYYPEIDEVLAKNPPENKSVFKSRYYNPFFLTSEGVQQFEHGKEYRAVSSNELVQKEMSKKELKRVNKK